MDDGALKVKFDGKVDEDDDEEEEDEDDANIETG